MANLWQPTHCCCRPSLLPCFLQIRLGRVHTRRPRPRKYQLRLRSLARSFLDFLLSLPNLPCQHTYTSDTGLYLYILDGDDVLKVGVGGE
jgi:hypothetical protein